MDQIFLALKQFILTLAGKLLHGSLIDLLSMIINMAAILLFAPLLNQGGASLRGYNNR